MIKKDLVEQVSNYTGVDFDTTKRVINATLDAIKGSVQDEEDVFLRGFGTFLAKTQKEKKARNITAKTQVIIPERKVAAFRPSGDFKI